MRQPNVAAHVDHLRPDWETATHTNRPPRVFAALLALSLASQPSCHFLSQATCAAHAPSSLSLSVLALASQSFPLDSLLLLVLILLLLLPVLLVLVLLVLVILLLLGLGRRDDLVRLDGEGIDHAVHVGQRLQRGLIRRVGAIVLVHDEAARARVQDALRTKKRRGRTRSSRHSQGTAANGNTAHVRRSEAGAG